MPVFARAAFVRAAFVRAAFAFSAFAAVTLCAADLARAQEIVLTGPLKAAPSLARRYSLRAGRIDLGVTPGASFGSSDRPSLLAGGESHYFPWDAFGAGAFGTWAFPVGDGETRLRAAASPELVFVPVTGRAVAFDDIYFRFDLHLLGGPALAFTREGGNDETAWAPMAGVGFRGFCGKWWSKSLTYRIVFGDPVRHLVTLSFTYWLIEPHYEE